MNYEDFPNYISLGGGEQSTAMFLMACKGLIKPEPEAAIFADTGSERDSTYRNIEKLTEYGKEHYIPVITVRKGDLKKDIESDIHRVKNTDIPWYVNTKRLIQIEEQKSNLIEEQIKKLISEEEYRQIYKSSKSIFKFIHFWENNLNNFEDRIKRRINYFLEIFDRKVKDGEIKEYWTPDKTRMIGRHCTQHYKALPIREKIKELCNPDFKYPAILWIGISLEESLKRMGKSKVKYLIHRYPLVEKKLTREDLIKWMDKNGFESPGRSSCTFCPYHTDREWNELSKEEFEEVCKFEEKSGDPSLMKPHEEKIYFTNERWLHRSRQPLRSKPFNLLPEEDLKEESCDSGYCFQ